MWIFWALISALFAASRRTSQKRISTQLNPFTIGLAIQVLSLPIVTISLLLQGTFLNPLDLSINFWLPLLIVSFIFYPVNAYVLTQAIKNDELSKVLPLQSLWPVMSLLPAWLVFHESPTLFAALGIVLTVLGVYVLGLKGRALHHPLQPFREERGSRYMLFGVVLITLAGILDKIAIQASDALYYSFASTVGAVIGLLIVVFCLKINELKLLKNHAHDLGLIGTFQGISYTTYLLGIASGPIAYVSAIRGSNVLMGAFLGIIILKESLTKPKIASFVLILFGGILLAFSST